MGLSPPGGGGGGTDSLKVPTAKLPPLLLGPACPSVFFDRPLFFRVTDHRPPKSNILDTKLPTMVMQLFSKAFHTINTICISQNRVKTNTSYKFFLPSKELTTQRFWGSLPPLRVAVWQLLAIQYLSAPPPPGCSTLGLSSEVLLWGLAPLADRLQAIDHHEPYPLQQPNQTLRMVPGQTRFSEEGLLGSRWDLGWAAHCFWCLSLLMSDSSAGLSADFE